MPYTLYKTNGIVLTTVEDGSLNLTTDLQLVGKNYAGYGQVVNENVIKLLENFANSSAPTRPIAGQLWYDTVNKKLKLYNGTKFKQLTLTDFSSKQPTDLNNGEFWWDSTNLKLYLKNNNSFVLIGPGTVSQAGGTATGGGVNTSKILSSTNIQYDVINLTINDTPVAVISPDAFTVDQTDPIVDKFTKIKYGITLLGADPITGISTANQSYFWGTAADSLRLAGNLSTDYLLKTEVTLISNNITSLGNITYISSGSPSTPGAIEGAWELTPGSTLQSTYADLAERYEADAVYEVGTVLVIGGEKEVTTTEQFADTRVAGIVSKNPAYMMNSEAGSDETHPYIALKGRVPCKVVGFIEKGDLLVTSAHPGYATAAKSVSSGAVIGKALEGNSEGFGVIEVKV